MCDIEMNITLNKGFSVAVCLKNHLFGRYSGDTIQYSRVKEPHIVGRRTNGITAAVKSRVEQALALLPSAEIDAIV
ncbi:MAG: hypothetical protein LBF95_02720 [Treponema sp.]|nr:hypothetical protein [Treponema sp.]